MIFFLTVMNRREKRIEMSQNIKEGKNCRLLGTLFLKYISHDIYYFHILLLLLWPFLFNVIFGIFTVFFLNGVFLFNCREILMRYSNRLSSILLFFVQTGLAVFIIEEVTLFYS